MRNRPVRVLAVVAVAAVALSSCGGAAVPDLTKMSVKSILHLAARNARAQSNIGVTISTPATLQREVENRRHDVRGFATSHYGVVHVVRLRATSTGGGSFYYLFNTTFLQSHEFSTLSVVAFPYTGDVRIAAIAIASHWLHGPALAAAPYAVTAARTMFLTTPRSLQQQLFDPLIAATAVRGGVVIFDHVRAIPLTLSTTGEVLFVSTGANPKPLGASVPLGANSSPVIFRFSYPRSVSIHRPHALTNLCDLNNSNGVLPQIHFFGGSYSSCSHAHS